jgi:uncharacterized membrane protein
MASYRAGILITNILTTTLAVSVAVFTVVISYLLAEAFLSTSFNMSLTTNTSGITNSFAVYGFISIEACFIAVVVAFAYTTIKAALRKNYIQVEIDE